MNDNKKTNLQKLETFDVQHVVPNISVTETKLSKEVDNSFSPYSMNKLTASSPHTRIDIKT